MPIVEIDGSGMNVVDVGRGDAVLLAHGFLCDAEMWGPQLAALSRRHRVIVPELWGHGGSGPLPRRTRDMRDLARQHLTLLDKLSIGACTLVGFSLGGRSMLEMALLAPMRVRGLVLMSTYAGLEPPQSLERYTALIESVEAAGWIMPPVADAIVSLYFSANAARTAPHQPPLYRERLLGWNRARLADSILPLARMNFDRRDLMPELARLEMPALVMHGAHDAPRPPAEGRRMAERIGCPFVEIPDSGHIASLENPAFVSAALCDFLRRIASGEHATARA